MITLAFDEYGKFEERELKNAPLSMIAGVMYDDKDIEGERDNELKRIRMYLSSVCRDAKGYFPESLHFNMGNNQGRLGKVESIFENTFKEFIKKGTYKTKKLIDKEREGEYRFFAYIKTKAGKKANLPDVSCDITNDTLLSNLYIRMVNDTVNRMIFNNPDLRYDEKVYFDLPTRSYGDNVSEEEIKRYKAMGYRVGEKNKSSGTGVKDIVYITGSEMFRSAIERELYHMKEKRINVTGISTRSIRYKEADDFTDDDITSMSFLYLADMICAVSHKDNSGHNYKISKIKMIPDRIKGICGVEPDVFYYDNIDDYYAQAYELIREKKYTGALGVIYDGMQLASECRELYRNKWFSKLLGMFKKDVDINAYAEAVDEFRDLSHTNNIEQNKLAYPLAAGGRTLHGVHDALYHDALLQTGLRLHAAIDAIHEMIQALDMGPQPTNRRFRRREAGWRVISLPGIDARPASDAAERRISRPNIIDFKMMRIH